MSWDYRVDEKGCLEVLVSRWCNSPPPEGKGTKEVLITAFGFEPFEEVQVEILADDGEEKAQLC